jgi:hypothetical protein
MKRAKIILAVIALSGIVGAVFAHKTRRCVVTLYKTNAAGLCSVTTHTALTTAAQFPGQVIETITNLYSTAPTRTSCPTTTWYTCE